MMSRAMTHRAAVLAITGLTAWAGASCNVPRLVVRTSSPVFGQSLGVLQASGDPDLAGQAAPALLMLLEGLLAADPENPALLALLAQGIYEHTFAFVDEPARAASDPGVAAAGRQRARAQYLKVYELGLRLLRRAGVRLTLQRSALPEVRRAVARADRRAVPGLVWTAVGAGSAALTALDEPWLLDMASKVPALLERAAALQPGYASGLAHAALALFWARDVGTGGSALRARAHFEQALAVTGRRYLPWLLLYARHWAWQFQSLTEETVGTGPAARRQPVLPRDKRALFVALLDEVRRFPLDRAPEHRLANTLAQRWAAALYPRKDDFLAQVRPGGPDAAKEGRP